MSELETGTVKRNVDEEFIENMVEAEYDRDRLQKNWDELKEYVEKFPAVWLKMTLLEERG